jgi:CubicO group peptidase (beta-lactamase class C family)
MSRTLKVDSAQRPPAVYPGATWDTRSPGQVGLSSAKLDELRDWVGGRGCVVRYGYVAYTWGDPGLRADVASASKPVNAHFLFRAVEEGRIPSFDAEVCRWEPRLKDINVAHGNVDAQITWRHMANQTSCYGLAEAPGTAFDYNDWQMALFCDTLYTVVYGVTWETVDAQILRPGLTDPLQCEDDPTLLAFGIEDRPGRLGISPRDFCRFGLLYLRKGSWNGRQLIDERHATMAVTDALPAALPRAGWEAAEMVPEQRSHGSKNVPDNQSDHWGSYSWLWWVNGVDRQGQRMWPDAPPDTFGAFGHWGPRALYIIPSLDIVISYNDAHRLDRWDNRPDNPTNRGMKMLVGSVIDIG